MAKKRGKLGKPAKSRKAAGSVRKKTAPRKATPKKAPPRKAPSRKAAPRRTTKPGQALLRRMRARAGELLERSDLTPDQVLGLLHAEFPSAGQDPAALHIHLPIMGPPGST